MESENMEYPPSPSIISFLHCCFGIYYRIIPIALPLTRREHANGQNLLYLQGLFPFLSHTPLPQKERVTLSTNSQGKSNFSKTISFSLFHHY